MLLADPVIQRELTPELGKIDVQRGMAWVIGVVHEISCDETGFNGLAALTRRRHCLLCSSGMRQNKGVHQQKHYRNPDKG